MKTLTTVSILFFSTLSYGQINYDLSQKIDSLVTIDKKWRGLLRQTINKEIDTISFDFVSSQIKIIDSLNYIAIKQLFNQYGYMGYNKVGQESSHNFWLLVQHADNYPTFQDSVLTKMKIEADNENASLLDYAYLLDRVKVNTGQLQIYGTQMQLNNDSTSFEPKPTSEPEKLNERRLTVGLGTIEEYINTMNNRYFGSLNKK